MKFKRFFTSENTNVYDVIKFKITSSEIKNPDGNIVFSAPEIEVPENFSQVASDIIAQKYFRKAGVPVYLKKVKEEDVPDWLWKSKPDEKKMKSINDDERYFFKQIPITRLICPIKCKIRHQISIKTIVNKSL